MTNSMAIQLRQVSTSSSKASIRAHEVLIDRPATKGGTDVGPMGGELFLTAVGGCFMSNLLAAISSRQAPISNVQTDVIGILADSPARFIAVELSVTADTVDHEMLDRLVAVADRGCIMMNTLRGNLDVRVQIATPAPVR
ncbi:MAG TPA: OsmC family protein [Bryobacteraceae bacterium]|jgi:putative redox protein